MAHDRNGTLLKVGDIVNIPARVESISTGDENLCCLDVETTLVMPGNGHKNKISALSTKQVERLALLESAEPAPPIAHVMQFFAYAHLPEKLQAISRPFAELARQMIEYLPSNAETTTMLRKLLEAKDCAVRAQLAK